jgi:peptidoglycan/LPS O-acetylase OafA/YrhL
LTPLRQHEPTDKTDHLVILEMLRGIAALVVALLHVREITWIGMREFIQQHGIDGSLMSLAALASLPLAWGSIGVPVFFVLSGYVIHRGSRTRLLSRNAAISFLRRRFVRIYPVFLVSIAITALCDSWSAGYGLHAKHGDLSVANAIMNACALVGIIGSPYGSNVALWSLPIEIQLYCVYPIALVAWRRLGPSRMMLLASVITVTGAVLQCATGLICALTYFAPWWLGAYVADRESQGKRLRSHRALGLALVSLGCLACSLKFGLASHMAWSLGFAMILDTIVRHRESCSAVPLGKGLVLLGTFSYSLYAVHTPVAVAFNAVAMNGAKAVSLVWTMIAMVPVMLAAYLLYVLVERPSATLLVSMRTADRS